MKTWRWALLFVSAGALAFACSSDETGEDDEGATSENTSSATGTGGGSTVTSTATGTSTATSTGTGMCSITMVNGDPACDSCATQNCCTELENFDANNQASIDALISCAQTNQCCFYPICDAMFMGNSIGYFFAQDCAMCNGTNCCTEVKDCLADTQCANCLLMGTPADCDATTLDEAVDTCEMTNCDMECGGGAGGAGGGGG